MLALGTLVLAAASPATAQMVIGGERPSVDVNWGVLDKLGPEPTLPGLVTRKPQPVKPAASTSQGVVFKPYGGATAAAPKPAKVVKAKVEKPAAVAAPQPPVVAALPQIPAVPPAEKVAAPSAPPKPAKVDLTADVPPPPKPAKAPVDSKVKAPAPTTPTPAPVIAAVPPAPPALPVKAEPAPVPAPSAVQFVKAPEPAPAPVPPVPAPPAPIAVQPPVPLPVVVAPPPAPVAPPPVVVQAPAAPQQLAAVAPPVTGSIRKGDNLSVLFAMESEHLPDSSRGDLEKLAQKMERDEGLTLQLLAYAAGDEANASKARRLSLTRALKVRTYLMELGVRSTRIEVRALGNKIEGGPADRVDVVLGSR